MTATPLSIVQTYYREIWSEHDVDRIPALCADPVIRHDSRGDSVLSHEQQRQRILAHADKGLDFTIVASHGDADHATIIWQISSTISDFRLSGIEVARVVDGRIAEVWNATRELPWI